MPRATRTFSSNEMGQALLALHETLCNVADNYLLSYQFAAQLIRTCRIRDMAIVRAKDTLLKTA